MKKNILFITNNFWPENFRSNDIVNLLSSNFNITVLTGYPTYPEKKIYKNSEFKKNTFNSHINICRVPTIKRTYNKFYILLNYISFIIFGSTIGVYKLQSFKFDYIICFASSPVYQSILTILFAKLKKSKSIIWVQDIWPETLEDIGYIKNKSILNFIKFTVNYLLKKHDLILTQSEAYKNQIKSLFPKSKYLPNPVDKFEQPFDEQNSIYFEKDIKYIAYTGNIGLAQNLDLFLDVAKKFLNKKKIRFLIVGNGVNFDHIKNRIINEKINNSIIVSAVAKKYIPNIILNSCAVFLSLKQGYLSKFVIPAKFQTYTYFGKPIISNSLGDVESLINKYKCGFVVEDENINKFYTIIDKIMNLSKNELKNYGDNAKTLFKCEFDDKIIIDKFKKIINEL